MQQAALLQRYASLSPAASGASVQKPLVPQQSVPSLEDAKAQREGLGSLRRLADNLSELNARIAKYRQSPG